MVEMSIDFLAIHSQLTVFVVERHSIAERGLVDSTFDLNQLIVWGDS
jgi:hypothetical protein